MKAHFLHVIALTAFGFAVPGHGCAQDADRLPAELHGFWDVAPYPCMVDSDTGSDSRLEIQATFIRGYEEIMDLREARQVSEGPPAWRVLALSRAAPPELQLHSLYVLSGEQLIIADELQSQVYVRCRPPQSPGTRNDRRD